MKRWELLLAGLLLCSFPVSAYNVFAPNSFEDVQPDSYAYQTLRDMCGQGKIPGYSASFFDSGRKISRYELAGVLQSALKDGKDLSSKDKQEDIYFVENLSEIVKVVEGYYESTSK